MNYQLKKLISELRSQDRCTCGCEDRKWIDIKSRPNLKLTTFRK